jgi:hypothetical protein
MEEEQTTQWPKEKSINPSAISLAKAHIFIGFIWSIAQSHL